MGGVLHLLLRRRQWCSLQKGDSRGRSCLVEVPNHLSQGQTHPKPSLPSWPWSPVSLPWPDRDRKPLQHFLLFPAYKFCERKSAITRFQKKKIKREKRNQRIKDHQEKPSRRLYPSIIRVKHQLYLLSNGTLATSITTSAGPKMARLSASGLRTGKPRPPPGAKKGHHHQPTAAPPETGEVKKQTSNSRSSSGRKYRKHSEASIRPRRGL